MTLRDELVRVLAENGLSGDGELHSWRCHHPDRYGACTCVETLVDELVAVSETAVSAAPATLNVPPIPPELCGFPNVISGDPTEGCSFTPHEGKHSWEGQ